MLYLAAGCTEAFLLVDWRKQPLSSAATKGWSLADKTIDRHLSTRTLLTGRASRCVVACVTDVGTGQRDTEGEGCGMVAKCANPSCSHSFLYLTEGRLFRLEPESASIAHDSPAGDGPQKVEYFWLRADCSDSMTLRLGPDGKVTAQPLAQTNRDNPRDLAIISRHRGMLLRSVGVGRGRRRA